MTQTKVSLSAWHCVPVVCPSHSAEKTSSSENSGAVLHIFSGLLSSAQLATPAAAAAAAGAGGAAPKALLEVSKAPLLKTLLPTAPAKTQAAAAAAAAATAAAAAGNEDTATAGPDTDGEVVDKKLATAVAVKVAEKKEACTFSNCQGWRTAGIIAAVAAVIVVGGAMYYSKQKKSNKENLDKNEPKN